MKRSIDILFSFIALVIFFIPFIIIGVLIKLDSKGRIFFVQKRVGKNAAEFSMYKFRTMREDSESSGALTVGERDSRITHIGYYLRKYKVDELPQFFNVLKGDMSMVGPRPEVKKYVEMYSEEQRKILYVKPGITDIASLQFSDESNILSQHTDAEEAYVSKIMPAKISLSLKYQQDRSLVSDLGIMAKTAGKIIAPLAAGENMETFLLSLLVFSLPFYEKISAGLAVAVAVYRIFNRKIFSDARQVTRSILAGLFIAYYLAHLAGTLYSANLDYAFFDLQVKLPFLFFPLLLLVPLARPGILKPLKTFFIAGCSVASLWCLGAAIVQFYKHDDTYYFFYGAFSYFIHVTYFAIYLNLCILFLADELIASGSFYRGKLFKLLLLVFLFLTVILLAGRTALLTCFITTLGYAVVISIHRKVLKRTSAAIVLLLGFLMAAAVYSNHIYNRFSEVTEAVVRQAKPETKTETGQPETKTYTSVSVRMELWQDSWELIKQNPWFGVGTGDIKDVLKEKFIEKKFYYGAESKFNPHNQFLHTGVTLGLVGLVILFLMLVIPSLRAWKNKNYLFVFLCIIIAFNCMTESVLEVQKGVLFFSLFGLLLFNPKPATG